MSVEGKPSVLIIGGLGYIGRWLALHIHKNKLASEIRIVDKLLPQLSWLAPEFEEPCSNFMQGDMSRQATLDKVFARADGSSWDYVFNCGGETKYSQEADIYQQRIVDLAVAAGKEAAKRKVKLFVELSDARVYKHDTAGSKELDTPKPWLPLAKCKLHAEEELQKIEGLNLMILRLANVYGPYSSKYLSTVLCNARVYQHLNQEMKWLWTKDLRTNTIHVTDTVRAIWDASEWYIAGKKGWNEKEWGKTPLFNVVDDGDTSQGVLVENIEKIFHIKAGFAGSLISQLAKLNLGEAVDEANDSVLTPWAELLHVANITRCPLSPFLEKELLKDSNLSVDGTRFKDVIGFTFEVPKVTEGIMNDMIESYKRMNWWP